MCWWVCPRVGHGWLRVYIYVFHIFALQITSGSFDENMGMAWKIANAMNKGLDEAGGQKLKKEFKEAFSQKRGSA